jgi:hypothetical protein
MMIGATDTTAVNHTQLLRDVVANLSRKLDEWNRLTPQELYELAATLEHATTVNVTCLVEEAMQRAEPHSRYI